MDKLARDLEAINPIKNVLASPLINAKWELLYTTSSSILGTSRPALLRPQGPIYQTIGEHPFLYAVINLAAYMQAYGVMGGAACRCGQPHCSQSGDLALLQPGMSVLCLSVLLLILAPMTRRPMPQVQAELTPETSSRVAVQFKLFRILGLIPVNAPPNARGKLDTTYLDDTLRVNARLCSYRALPLVLRCCNHSACAARKRKAVL